MTSNHPTKTDAAPRPAFARQKGERTVRAPSKTAAAPPPSPAPPPTPPNPVPTPPGITAAGVPATVPAAAATPAGAPPAKAASAASRERWYHRYKTPSGKVELAILAGIVVLAIVLRLKDILASPIIGAEDPYRHMERTYDLIQGKGAGEYPPGLAILMAPFALMGPDVFYTVARFAPVAFGVGMVVALYCLSRAYLHPAGALTAALLGAVVPELIRRTTLLFPTGIDLALVPVLFLLVLRASEGSRKHLAWAAGLAVALLATHPWVFVLVVPPIGLFWLGEQFRQQWAREKHGNAARVAMTAGLVPVAGIVVWMLDFGEVATRVSQHALPRLSAIVAEPSSITPLPLFVDFPTMIGVPVLGLAAAGAVMVFLRPTRLGVLTLLFTALLLPLILVDWFDLWYVPHRTVAYFALGIATLVGILVAEVARRLANDGRPKAEAGLTIGALALVLFLAMPTGAASPTWYRIFDDQDFAAWESLDEEHDASFVMAGSWQARMGYRATTGNDALYSPDFFDNPTSRDYYINQHPDLVVLVDNYTVSDGRDTAFLDDTSQWTLIGQWGDNRAYARY